MGMPIPGACGPLGAVDPSIRGFFGPGPVSRFEVKITLPDTNPTPGFSGLFFPNQTAYSVQELATPRVQTVWSEGVDAMCLCHAEASPMPDRPCNGTLARD
jgi:hypothetical protein